jgi:hypothetical protein
MQACCAAAAAAVSSVGCLPQPARASHVVPTNDLQTQISHLHPRLQHSSKHTTDELPCECALVVSLSLQSHAGSACRPTAM